jgi:hypothetical protein
MKIARCLVILSLCLAALPASAATTPVPLSPKPGTKLDAQARQLVAADLARAASKGDAPLVLVAEASLGKASDRPAIFIQLQSERVCGSAGCNTSVYLERNRKWLVVLDSVGGTISVDSARHNGLRDLIVGKGSRWIWNGKTYVENGSATQPRPTAKPAPKPQPKPTAPDTTKPDTTKPDAAKPDAAKPDAPVGAPKSEPPKPEAPKPATSG